jgi:hypothetical protein
VPLIDIRDDLRMPDPKRVAEDGRALSAQLDALWDPIGVYEGPEEDRAPAGEY